MKKSFVLYADQHGLLADLDNGQKAWLLDALFLYAAGKDVPIAPCGELKILMIMFSQQIERDAIKWEERANRSRENGVKGGRPKKNKNPEEPKKPSWFIGNPEEPKKPVTVTGTVTVSSKEESQEELRRYGMIVPKKKPNFRAMAEATTQEEYLKAMNGE